MYTVHQQNATWTDIVGGCIMKNGQRICDWTTRTDFSHRIEIGIWKSFQLSMSIWWICKFQCCCHSNSSFMNFLPLFVAFLLPMFKVFHFACRSYISIQHYCVVLLFVCLVFLLSFFFLFLVLRRPTSHECVLRCFAYVEDENSDIISHFVLFRQFNVCSFERVHFSSYLLSNRQAAIHIEHSSNAKWYCEPIIIFHWVLHLWMNVFFISRSGKRYRKDSSSLSGVSHRLHIYF